MIGDMNASEIRQKFLKFFEERGHRVVPSSSLIPDDPSVLLTTAGMQQFKPYYSGLDPETTIHPSIGKPVGKNAASVQKSFRTSDIDEVGDESHLTFFEMLGNFSFGYKPGEPRSPQGGYFKKEAIQYAYDFVTKEMKSKIDYVTVFSGVSFGGSIVPADSDSEKIWKNIDHNLDVRKKGHEDNFWGPTGAEGPCGPTTEIYVNGVEIWNIVFNEYYQHKDKKLEKLKTPGVDTGMGLERLAMVVQKTNTIFETDLFREPFQYFLAFGEEGRIISDHLRGSIFLIADGIKPSNKDIGYILRRLIRRIVVACKINKIPLESLDSRINRAIKFYKFYPELGKNEEMILTEIDEEIKRFNKTLEKGLNEFFKKYPEVKAQKIEPGKSFKPHIVKHVNIDDAFHFHQTFGLTIDIIKDLAKRGGHFVDEEAFNKSLKKHQEISRAGISGFKGGLVGESEITTRMHTATHLLLKALQIVLGFDVHQRGSNINEERIRFDFSYGKPMTEEEVKKVEDIVNEKIQENLPVIRKETTVEEAKKIGAEAQFVNKYGDKITLYSIGDPSTGSGQVFSHELCGGPHVKKTGEIGKFKIIKEESSSAGVRRIRAIIE